MKIFTASLLFIILLSCYAVAGTITVDSDNGAEKGTCTTLAQCISRSDTADQAWHIRGSLTEVQSNYSSASVHAIPSNVKVILEKGSSINNTTSFSVDENVIAAGGVFSGSGSITINGNFDANYKVFTGTSTVTYGAKAPKYVKPILWGALGDDNIANASTTTTALAKAATAAGYARTLLLDGIYAVTATSGNYALTTFCPIKGLNPIVSGIHNVGAGSALLLGNGKSGTIYYNRWENFSVIGNNLSQDGIVTMNTVDASTTATAYSSFNNIYSTGHGRYGVRHRNSFGTKYIDCKFQNNLGAGIIFETPGAPPSIYEGFANGVTLLNCDSRHNGSTAAQDPSTGGASGATFAPDANGVYHGGVVIIGAAGLQWQGGVIENNDAWGVLVVPAISGASVRSVHFSPGYMEANPASAPLGGNFYAEGPWSNITVTKSNLFYGGLSVSQNGFNFYITGGETATGGNSFNQYDNSNIAVGAGVKSFAGGASQTPAKVYQSKVFIGDLSGSPVVTTIATLLGTNANVTINGTISSKRDSDGSGAVYPFIAGQNGTATLYASIGAAIAGTSTAPPTIAWSGNNLQITTPAYVIATVSITDASYIPPGNYSLAYNQTVFGTMMNRE